MCFICFKDILFVYFSNLTERCRHTPKKRVSCISRIKSINCTQVLRTKLDWRQLSWSLQRHAWISHSWKQEIRLKMPQIVNAQYGMNVNDWCKTNALNECVRTMIWFDLIWFESKSVWTDHLNKWLYGRNYHDFAKNKSLVTHECVCSDNVFNKFNTKSQKCQLEKNTSSLLALLNKHVRP